MREELGLERGHVDVHGAFAFAALAGQAEVERVLHRLVAPVVRDDFALEHLEQQPGPAARRMFLFARDHVARAHHAMVEAAALAHSHAPHDGALHPPLVLGELEVRRRRPLLEVGAEAEVLGRVVRRHHLAGIHLPLRVPQRLELAERADQVIAEHLRQQRRARLPVAVLAGE